MDTLSSFKIFFHALVLCDPPTLCSKGWLEHGVLVEGVGRGVLGGIELLTTRKGTRLPSQP
jgi:hypothetical protein